MDVYEKNFPISRIFDILLLFGIIKHVRLYVKCQKSVELDFSRASLHNYFVIRNVHAVFATRNVTKKKFSIWTTQTSKHDSDWKFKMDDGTNMSHD